MQTFAREFIKLDYNLGKPVRLAINKYKEQDFSACSNI